MGLAMTVVAVPRLPAADDILTVCEHVKPAAVMLDVHPSFNEKCVPSDFRAAKAPLSTPPPPAKAAVSSLRSDWNCWCTSAKSNDRSKSLPETPVTLILPTGTVVLEGNDKFSRHYCSRLPIFIILVSLLEIGVFFYDCVIVDPQHNEVLNGSSSVPRDSLFIYRPDRRLEVWRFFTYMVLHANWLHLSFNVIMQLLFGVPLELVHGSVRVAVVYLAGVFAGSLGTSIVDSAAYLVGASGGVYALLAAQLANLSLNFGQMRYAATQSASVLIFVLCELGYMIYSKYVDRGCAKAVPSISYTAHLTGALAGFTMGLLNLRCPHQKGQSSFIWWLAMCVYMSFTLFAIVFNLINSLAAQKLKEETEALKRHWLHDIGFI